METTVRFLIELFAIFLIYYAFDEKVYNKIHSKKWWKQLIILTIAIIIIKTI
tara:strand:+ start:132 stop:287 length:156 start_codon:yes stop_codon:yes gene_type:complete